MKLLKRLSKEEPALNNRRKNGAERMRRQHEIEEERRKRIQTLRPDLGLLCFW
jgi:hypothetical protein